MKRLMISAMGSGSGKTVLTAGLLRAFQKRGLSLRAFKCGPDYLDPMFHSRVLGIPCGNLDLFLMGEENVRRSVERAFHRDVNPRQTLEGEADSRRSFEGAVDSERSFEGAEDSERSFEGAVDSERSFEGAVDSEQSFARDVNSGQVFVGNVVSEQLCILEGAMGFYDGIGGTARNSAWEIAKATNTPVILAVRTHGQSLTLAAQILGMLRFAEIYRKNSDIDESLEERPIRTLGKESGTCIHESHIVGVIFVDCKPSLHAHLKGIIERETDLPVLGYLPPMEEARLPERHLGLLQAEEVADFQERFDKIAEQLEKTVNLDAVLSLTEEKLNNFSACTVGSQTNGILRFAQNDKSPVLRPRIAVARDAAFSFLYEESLEALREAGADLVFFSPLKDAALPPQTQGLYLPGGYPELFAKELSANASLREEIRVRVANGLPTVAECGGFLYLGQMLAGDVDRATKDGIEAGKAGKKEARKEVRENLSAKKTGFPQQNSILENDACWHGETIESVAFRMVGVLPGHGLPAGHLVRFGYKELVAREDSLLLRKGEHLPVHEFHHWDSTDIGEAFEVEKPGRKTVGVGKSCGFASPTLYAAFPHFCFRTELPLAERFVEAARHSHGYNIPTPRPLSDVTEGQCFRKRKRNSVTK